MTDFEFVFSLFGLLLGFSLVEVLGGMAKVIEAQLRAVKVGADTPDAPPFRAGWLTPLLGLFIMLDVISFWGSAWVARGQLDYNGRVAMGGLVFAGSYYVAAHLVFPTEKADWADLDAHYFRVRRAVFGTMIALTILQTAFMLTVPGVAAGDAEPDRARFRRLPLRHDRRRNAGEREEGEHRGAVAAEPEIRVPVSF